MEGSRKGYIEGWVYVGPSQSCVSHLWFVVAETLISIEHVWTMLEFWFPRNRLDWKEKSILSKWQHKELDSEVKQTNELIVFYTKKANDLFYFCLAYIFQFVLINKRINLCTIESSTKPKLSCDFSLCMRFTLPITIQTFDIYVNSSFSWAIKIQILIYLQNPKSFLRIRLLMNKSFFLKKIVCVVQ